MATDYLLGADTGVSPQAAGQIVPRQHSQCSRRVATLYPLHSSIPYNRIQHLQTMIDPDDREFFSWDPELPDPESEPDQAPATYGFLATVPLEIKREQFRALNNVLSDFRISDLFTTASQVRWAAGVIKLGLQLPIEDLDLISDALSQNSELLYTLHEIDFSHEKSDLSPEALQLLLAKSTTTVIRRLGVLFNPRPFFWDQMPTREIVHQSNQRMGKITESCITMPKPLSSQNTPTAPTSLRRTLSAKGALLRVTSARSGKLAQSATPTQEDIAGREVGDQKDKAEQHALEDGSELTNIGEMWGSSWEDTSGAANEDDFMANEQWLEVIGSQDDAGDSGPSSLQPPLKGSSMPPPSEPTALTTMQGDASTGIQPIHNTPGLPKTHVDDETLRERQKARLRRAAALWEGYVELLHRAIQVFLAVLEHNQPDVYCKELSSLHLWFVAIIDLVLSQGGNSPHLDPWVQRYRPHIGLEIWDITWATLGDRLEDVALTFAVAVWGRLVSTENINWRYMKNFTYWIHREKVMREWLKIIGDLSVCVMRLHYASSIAFKEYAESRPPNLLDTLNNLSSHSAEALLYYYMTVPLDTRMIPPNTYYTYVMEVCEIVNRMLDIEKVVVVDEVVHLQRPPSANYMLFYFGTPLFFMARAETDGTSESVTAKTQALVVLSRVLATEAQPEDPIHQKYRDRILRVLYEVFHKDSQAQIILPSVQLLLNKTAYIRPLIPDIVILSVREMQLVSSTVNVSLVHRSNMLHPLLNVFSYCQC
ncbi:hypothetical protein FBU59_001719 [Linderina macrospora]|uniref:Uncharacterized protein n=1 Tax=Linderina macrospora TaxID=4868 RepID=A0ACC1JDB8_9FUNG|nr:hypothetical protein FBU59_001719 [Linderina macrospora]